jgi:hypothetical protein
MKEYFVSYTTDSGYSWAVISSGRSISQAEDLENLVKLIKKETKENTVSLLNWRRMEEDE